MISRLRSVSLLATLSLIVLSATFASAAFNAEQAEQLSQDYRHQGFLLKFDDSRGLVRSIVLGDYSRAKAAIGTPEEIAERFLTEHANVLFGDVPVDIGGGLEMDVTAGSDIQLVTVLNRESLSGFQVLKQEYVRGVPVHAAFVRTNLNKQGQVTSVISSFEPNISLRGTTPVLLPSEAIATAMATIDNPGTDRKAPESDLVIYPMDGGILAYQTLVMLWDPFADYETFVDAISGDIIVQQDLMIHDGKHSGERISIEPHVPHPDADRGGVSAGKVDGSGDVLPANPLNGEPTRYGLRDGDPVVAFVENKVLARLDGTGFLRGPYADVDNSDQARANEPTLVYNYSPDVTNGAFHEVNVYWHLDEFQNYIQTSLNILNANNRQQPAFAHQGEDDNSSYSPGTGFVRFGDGGVDDSEDGEVVLHEYGHAIHDNIVSIGFGEAGAISEGFGDYLAASFGDNALVAEWDATSYNPGPPPFLRRTDGTKHYPEDLVGQVHADGEIISSAWWNLRSVVGNVIADQLIIESFFLVGSNVTMFEFADATVQVDQALYGGAHLAAIFQSYGDRGIGPQYLLEIDHTPLGDTEDQVGPYAVNCSILHTSPISDPNAVVMSWRETGGVFADVVMTSTGVDQYTADIPGLGADGTIEYYISVTDDAPVTNTLPVGAPGNFLSFDVGPDTELPVIAHTPLGDQPLLIWPATVQATVTDNLGIASVSVDWSLNSVAQSSFSLLVSGPDTYAADFPIAAGSLAFGDIIDYTINAVDSSSNSNSASNGPHSFEIIDAKGVVLIVDDDTSTKAGEAKEMPDKSIAQPGQDLPAAEKGIGAAAMQNALTLAGYVVTVEDAATTDPGTWGSYSVVISSSGRSNEPMLDAAFRQALVDYVAAGGKLVVEGGEVGYDAISSPGYPEIVTNVIHADDWNGDNAGALTGVLGQENHPIRITPNALPDPLNVTYDANFGDQDAALPLPDAYLVYDTTTDPDNAGILVFDDNAAPGSAQIVYLAFAFAQVTDPAVGDDLIENVVDFLLADEGVADASISGTALLQNSATHDGITITAQPGGATTVTGPGGNYSLTGLFAGTYTVTATPPAGWETASQTVAVTGGQAVTGVDFELRPVIEVTVCSQPGLAIPDASPTGVEDVLIFTEMGQIANITCSVDITHTWRGDLIVELTGPNYATVRLANRTGGSADNIVTSYDDLTPVDGPGSMNDFDGTMAVGTWRLFVSDNAGADTGTLNEWCVTISVIQEGTVATAASGLAAEMSEGDVRVSWNALDVSGVEGFNVLRQAGTETAKRVNSELLSPERGLMTFVDTPVGVETGTDLTYRLEVLLKSGQTEVIAGDAAVVFSPAVPKVFGLAQNRPNPFNPKTTISFDLPVPGRTTLRVYDVAGRLVDELLNADLPAQTHSFTWDGTDGRGRKVATGTYYYQVRSGRYEETKRMTLVK